MEFNDLTEDQKERARACKTSEELVELAKSEGVELTDEQLETITGGWNSGCKEACYGMEYLHKPKPKTETTRRPC